MNEFEKYFEMSEQTSWKITDLNWNKIDKENISDFDKQAILATAIIEHGVPHYSDTWARVKDIEKEWELWQFATLWAGEEHRHSYSLKKLADILDVKGDPRYYSKSEKGEYYYNEIANNEFGKLHKEKCECYTSIAGMLVYTTIQELVTAKYYQLAAKRTKSKFLKQLLDYIAKDELKHHAFYGNAIKRYYEKSNDKEQYIRDVIHAVKSFEMPHGIYDLKVDFFDKENLFGKFEMAEIKLRVGRLLAFNKSIVKGLLNLGYSNEEKIPVSI